VYLHVFLILALDGSEWSASCSGHFTPGTQWMGWVGPKPSLDTVAKRRILYPGQELNLSHPAYSLVTILTELLQLLSFQIQT